MQPEVASKLQLPLVWLELHLEGRSPTAHKERSMVSVSFLLLRLTFRIPHHVHHLL